MVVDRRVVGQAEAGRVLEPRRRRELDAGGAGLGGRAITKNSLARVLNEAIAETLPPLTFLGGTFYSIHILPPFWQTVTLFNPVVYLISGFRWSFFETADVSVALSLAMTVLFLAICLATVWLIFKTGYRLKK